MRKLLPFILLAAVVVAIYAQTKDFSQEDVSKNSTEQKAEVSKDSSSSSISESVIENEKIERNVKNAEPEDEGFIIKSASEIYSNADDAFEAIINGAQKYDDSILDQFADLDASCKWCGELFEKLRSELTSTSLNNNERGYLAEILATNGAPDNVAALINAFNDSSDDETASVYKEALELANGNDDTVRYLSTQLDTDNKVLKEAILAAVTNHGSPLAIELLYNETINSNNPDGFYSQAIGLGEVYPDEKSLPYLSELANKRDEYSHLAIKSLLNYGIDGLRMVAEILEQSTDQESNAMLLKDAIDHVSYEEASKEFAETLLRTSDNPSVKEFAREIIKDFDDEDDEEDGNEENENGEDDFSESDEDEDEE